MPVASSESSRSADSEGLSETEKAPESSAGTTGLTARFRSTSWKALLIHFLVLLVFMGVAAALVVTSVHRSPGLSPFDETTHIDYVWRISHGEIPAKGGVLAPALRGEAACHGMAIKIVTWPPCNLRVVPPASAFPAGGQDYNFGHPPLYYLITGYLARLGAAIYGGSGHFITMARLVGVGWLGGAMFVLYLALRRFRVPLLVAIAGGLLLATSPSVIYASSTVTNDAAAPLCGAVALYFMAQALVDRKVRPIPLFVAAALVTATKVINALPFLAMGAMFAVMAVVAWRNEHRDKPNVEAERKPNLEAESRGAQARTYLMGVIAIGLGVLVVYKGWAIFQSGRGQADWINPIKGVSGRPISGLPFDEWGSTLFSGFPPTNEYFLPVVLNGKLMVLWMRAFILVTGAATLGLVFIFRRGDYRWQLGATLIGGLLAFPIIVQIQVFLDSRLYFPVVLARYGLSLVPWCVAAVAIIAAWRPFTRTFIVFTLAGLVLSLGTYAGFG
ncbi:glycosyltransferase family 39 protein [Jatrophihabitans sp. GAS493]|uniref:glycosyltransferase family 39 protein n=1 Tax=Jatrophihabitans sp. GAS493 TaxID=1907575 RepID=UPI001A7E1B17|nr:glycosyltransferase family 39 protein [Jatrophihabitans sp. GAS493]